MWLKWRDQNLARTLTLSEIKLFHIWKHCELWKNWSPSEWKSCAVGEDQRFLLQKNLSGLFCGLLSLFGGLCFQVALLSLRSDDNQFIQSLLEHLCGSEQTTDLQLTIHLYLWQSQTLTSWHVANVMVCSFVCIGNLFFFHHSDFRIVLILRLWNLLAGLDLSWTPPLGNELDTLIVMLLFFCRLQLVKHWTWHLGLVIRLKSSVLQVNSWDGPGLKWTTRWFGYTGSNLLVGFCLLFTSGVLVLEKLRRTCICFSH